MFFNILSDDIVFVNVDGKNLITPLTGFAAKGISTTGTAGMLIFIPTENYELLEDLIKVI